MTYNQIDKRINEILDNDTKLLIFNFTILWNIYEHFVFDTNYCPKKIGEKVITKINYNNDFSRKIDTIFLEFKEYLKKRNIEFSSHSLWINFGFNHKDKNEEQLNILNNIINITHETDKLYLLLLIIGRVRNNMFHGIKAICDLNMQKELFLISNEVLTLTLDSINSLYI